MRRPGGLYPNQSTGTMSMAIVVGVVLQVDGSTGRAAMEVGVAFQVDGDGEHGGGIVDSFLEETYEKL